MIAILLSTYNGEKYLETQLTSLINQNGVKADIYVRDDGSTDSTCNILNKWQDRGLLKWYSGENKGFAMSFLDLVSKVGDYDYYAFCDQDDIWLPNKLERAVSCLETLETQIQLYCSNLYYYKDDKVAGLVKDNKTVYNNYTCLVKNIATGCTIVFNRELKTILAQSSPHNIIAHDFWAYQTAMLFGSVYYDEDAYIYYRQHDNNKIGAKIGVYEIWKRRIRDVFSSRKDGRALQAEELLKCYSDKISEESKEIIGIVANYKKSIWAQMKLLFDSRYTMGRLSNDFWMKLRILLRKL